MILPLPGKPGTYCVDGLRLRPWSRVLRLILVLTLNISRLCEARHSVMASGQLEVIISLDFV